ncbi:MAG: hypothetical protein ACI87N_001050 [Flavobacteriales bacterium]|jgi:hypothetical protein
MKQQLDENTNYHLHNIKAGILYEYQLFSL